MNFDCAPCIKPFWLGHLSRSYTTSGLQTFHCLQTPKTGGGETLMVDGFQLALDFKEKYPEGFDFLATHPVEFRYLHTADEPNAHYRSKDVVFKMYPNR